MVLWCLYIPLNKHVKTLENTEGAIKKVKSREIGNIRYTRRRKAKQKHNKYVLGTTLRKQTQIT